MPTDRIASGIRFRGVLLQKIMWIAKRNHRSFNAQMEMLAEDCVQDFEKTNGEIVLDKEG